MLARPSLAIPAIVWLVAALAHSTGHCQDADVATCQTKAFWPKFRRHGRPPSSNEHLTYCSRWKDHTCCDDEQSNRARFLYSSMDYRTTTKKCREVWQLLQCAICSPDVGILNDTLGEDTRVPVSLDFCTKVYDKGETSQFAGDDDYPVRGCNPAKDVICSELRHWGVTPKGFCELAGFRVVEDTTSEGSYDGELVSDLQRRKDRERRRRARDGREKRRRRGKGVLLGLDTETLVITLAAALAAPAGYYLYKRHKRGRKLGYVNRSKIIKKLQREQGR